jgi:hypothetical protein
VDHDLAGEQLGHAGVVVLDDELLELDVEGQVLQHDAVGHAQHRHAGAGALGDQQVAAEGGVGGGQAVLGRHVLDQAAALEGGLAAQRHLQAHHQVAVGQAAQADQHHRRVGRQVAQLVDPAGACRHHGAVRTQLSPGLPAAAGQDLGDLLHRCLARQRQRAFTLVVEGLERALADVFLEAAQVGHDLGRVACDAQAGGQHQKAQNGQEPAGAVHREQAEVAQHLGPERPELVDVVVQRLVLLDDRADHRGDADHRQQRDREAHRRQQLVGGAQRRRAAHKGGIGHGRRLSGWRKPPKERAGQ